MSAELYTFSYIASFGQTLHLKINSLLFIIVRMRSDLYHGDILRPIVLQCTPDNPDILVCKYVGKGISERREKQN